MERVNETIDGVSISTYEENGELIVEYTYNDRNARTIIDKNTYNSILKFNYDSLQQMKILTVQMLKDNE